MAQTFDIGLNENVYLGMNDKYPAHLLPRGVFASVLNAFVDNDKIYKRGGTTLFGQTLGNFLLNGSVSFERTGGGKNVIVSRNGVSNAQLYSSSGGAFSAIGAANLTNSLPVNFTQASNRLFGFNGTEVVDVASDGTTVTKNRATVPIGKFAFWFHGYLFVAGVAGTPDRLFWSDLGDPTTFSGANFIDINPNDGDAITGLNILNDELIVFKQFSVWSISGWSGSTFSTTTAAGQNTQSKAAGIGAVSHRSIVSVGKDLYYLSFSGNIPHFRSLQQTVFSKTIEGGIISDELETTMLGLNKTQLSKCAGIYDGKYLYWSVPDGASTVNDLIVTLDPSRTFATPLGRMQSWVKFTGANISEFFTSTISGSAKIYGTDSAANGNVYLFNDNSVYTDNGTPIIMTVQYRDMMGHPSKMGKFLYLYLKYLSGSAGTLDINARIDQAADFSLQQALSLAGNSPALGLFILGTSVLGGSMISTNRTTLQSLIGHMVGVELVEDTENYCEVYDLQVWGTLKGFRSI